MRPLLPILVGVVLVACSNTARVSDSAPSADATILIHDVDSRRIVLGLDDESLTDGLMHRSSIKAWGDGRIVWLSKGTSFEGHFDPASFAALIKRLDHEDAFSDENARQSHTGPDSGYEVIEVELADRSLRLESWHEVYESSPEVVGTDHCYRSPNVTPLAVKKRDPPAALVGAVLPERAQVPSAGAA